MRPPWIGVDLDGTLASYDGWQGPGSIGEPVPRMVARVRGWLAEGKLVKIMTARVCAPDLAERQVVVEAIEAWCDRHLGVVLPVTHEKDFGMVELWDDRVVQVVPNEGVTVVEQLALMRAVARYAAHRDDCALLLPVTLSPGVCTCGLAEARAALRRDRVAK